MALGLGIRGLLCGVVFRFALGDAGFGNLGFGALGCKSPGLRVEGP